MPKRDTPAALAWLTRTQLIQFWLAHQPRAEQRTRLLLRSLDRQQQGLLPPEVSQYLAGPPLRRRPAPKPLTPYSPVEWDRLRHCCEKAIAEALAGQKAAVALAAAGRDPRTDGWRPAANQMWLLRLHGPMTTMEVAAYLGCSPKTVRMLGAPGEAASRLFPTMPAVVAFRLLLGMTSGIVPDGLEDLALEDVDWAGNATVLLDYVKGRTRRESLNLPAEAVRVLRRWLEYSAVLRPFAAQADRSALWLACHRSGQERVAAARFNDETIAGGREHRNSPARTAGR